MKLNQFIRANRTSIDYVISHRLRRPLSGINDAERRLWVLNDEGLYNWAKREGVRI